MSETFTFRQASESDIEDVWGILKSAIEQRRLDGSDQWQNGYPNEQTIKDDIASGYAYVLLEKGAVIAYVAIIFDGERAYDSIDGEWLNNGSYVAVHRIAKSPKTKTKGIAAVLLDMVEGLCRARGVRSIKLDTNFDNMAMIKILDRVGFLYCGEILFQGASRRAYEKIIAP